MVCIWFILLSLMKIFNFKDLNLRLLLSYMIFYPYNLIKKIIFETKKIFINFYNKIINEKKNFDTSSNGQIGGHLVDFFKRKKKYEILKFDISYGNSFDQKFNNKKLEKNIKKVILYFFSL